MNLVELGQRSVNFVTRGFEKAAANPSMQAGLAIPVGLASTIAIDAALYQSQTQHIIHQDMPSLSDQVVIDGSFYKLYSERDFINLVPVSRFFLRSELCSFLKFHLFLINSTYPVV